MMTPWKLFLFFIFVLVQSGVAKLIPRIVNGQDAKPGEFPFLVSLQYKMIDQHICGGAILNERFIITAAHCFSKLLLKDLQVVVGTTDLDKPKMSYRVISYHRHENYTSPRHLVNDIALAQVYPPIEFNELVSPVTLPDADNELSKYSKVVIPGWGSTKDPASDDVSKLTKVKVPVISQSECFKIYEDYGRPIFPSQFCTHETGSIRKGVCSGDSGGPVTIGNVLVGIVSWSSKDPDCASSKYPDVHTRVSSHLDWIRKNSM